METIPTFFPVFGFVVLPRNLRYIESREQRSRDEIRRLLDVLKSKMKTTKVAVAVLERNGTVLACQRKKGARYELKWEFPGGKVEAGESFEQCIHRELHEELSIELGAIHKTEKEISHYSDGGTYEVAFCYVREFSGDLRNNVCEQFRWVTPDELRSMDILEGNRGFVSRLTLDATS